MEKIRWSLLFFSLIIISLQVVSIEMEQRTFEKFRKNVRDLPKRFKFVREFIFKSLIGVIVFIIQIRMVCDSWVSSLGKILIRNIWISLILLPTIFITLFNFLGSLYINNIIGLTVNQFLLDIITITTNILGIALPISLTLYVFSYREQKTASASGIYSRNKSLIIFVILSILTILFGKTLVYVIKLDTISMNIDTTYPHSTRVMIWLIVAFFSVIYGIRMLIDTLRNVNVRWLINDLLKETDDVISNLLFAPTKKRRIITYPILHMYIESIYQLLTVSVEKNMNEVYEINYKKWEFMLSKLFEWPRLSYIDNTVRFEYLLKKDKVEFQGLYKTILRNHISLIKELSNYHKIEEAYKAINTFFVLKPRSKELNTEFLTCLQELAILMSGDKHIGLDPIYKGMEELAKDWDEKKGLVLVYKALLVNAVHQNDTKQIYNSTHSLSRCTEQEEFSLLQSDLQEATKRLQMVEGINSIPFNYIAPTGENEPKELQEFRLAVIFVLLQVTLKTIELGQYSSTGFLIKYIITNFDYILFNPVFNVFSENKAKNNLYLNKSEPYSKINVSFNFNKKTIEYCLNKLVILTYGQQKYIKENIIDFGFVPETYINTKHIDCSYLEHLFNAIEKVGDKYNLNFIENKVFWKEIQDVFTVKELV
ncbi:hypothetical protein [Brevibacillus laterosporus]|uniref:hypothetical protein n=1 Tax=Brevibacillus laterosporus TaxID=1465 RepID=UPI000E6CEDF0|nr:hypothetical protein [Brevibacillus laterosporus]AYB39946.1 hypothetical protein D5F52_17695 [Brevibacillus laterosporus]MBM7111313.1 hypothetical protein [Brevibacillus laterosporus]